MEKTIKYLENGEYHYATVRSVGDLAQLKTDSKETLVEAINELWNGGGNVDPSKVPKPEGYDQLVQDIADVVKNQQEISQQWIEWQNEEAQLTEERKQAYLQAMKEMQEAIDKAKADAAALDDKTTKLDEQITKTFSDLDTSIQNMHEQLQKEADRMNQDLQDTKGTLSTLRTDLQNTQMDNGRIHDELTNINGKFEHKVWQTDLDPLKEQIDRAETSVQQTKDELLGKASRQDLDTVTNTVSKLDTQLKETAKGVEISVKKDELGGEIAEALTNKTNLLLGTRRFTTNNWKQRENVTIQADPWKGMKVAKQTSPTEGIQQSYDVKAGTTYVFSLYAKVDEVEDGVSPQITLAPNALDTSLDTKIDVWRKEIDDITSDFQRYDLTFTPSEDCTIYPHVISNSNNPIFVCGYQLEIGKTSTPWEPNQEDVGDYVEKSEAQFNVYNDKIQALTEKQRQQGDTQEKLRTEVTQTAEGVKQVSESLKDTNGDITKLRGDLERTADHMKSEYETYTNKAVGQISDSTLNLIRNSSFQNKDEDFAQWQNVSTKANVRQDENGLCWVELTQSGLTTDNPQGLTSNYFNVKQGKVTVAVDIKSGDKATLDNESVLFLELYNDAKKRVDFRFVTLSELGLSKNLLDDHKVHRGLYRLGIDRNDAQYMTVKAHLIRNGDLYFTNFSARLSSIDDGAYEPNPDDINQQILKQNTKIEQNAKEVAIKANSVDVTRDIKSAVDGIQVGGVNLVEDGDANASNAFPLPNTHFQSHDFYHSGTKKMFNLNNSAKTELTADCANWFSIEAGQQYTLSFKGFMSWNVSSYDVWLLGRKVGTNGSWTNSFPIIGGQRLSNAHCETITKTFTAPSDWNNFEAYLRFDNNGSSDGNDSVFFFNEVKLEKGNKATSYSPAPGDTSKEIKSAKDAAIQVASDQINIHVNEISTQFDDKLNKRINEQKTASEKFTSDGIEQTVKKIIDVKNQVDGVNSKVDNLQIGGRNYIKNSESITMYPNGTDNYDLVWSVYNNAFSANTYCHGNNKTRFSFYLTPSKALSTARTYRIYWRQEPWTSFGTITVPANTTDTQYYELTMTTPTSQPIDSQIFIRFMSQDTSDVSYTITKSMLTIGDSFPDWQPAPEDTDSTIEAVSSKIDQTATSITSTIDSTKQDLQGQITQTANDINGKVSGVEDKVNGLKIGGRNLLLDTGRSFTGVGTNCINGDFNNQGGYYYLAGSKKLSDLYNQYGPSGYLTISFDWVASGDSISGQFYPQWYGEPWDDLANSNYVQISSTNKSGHYKSTVQLTRDNYSTSTTYTIRFRQDNLQGNVTISNVKLEVGNVATDWTPAPEDINKKIDTQVLDSANINDMKTQGHYFVKSLTGNPLTGWVYVDVMGFDGRIRQDVYQDGDSKHMYRRLFGSNWSDWEQGAYLSDVNNVKTEVTASVKNLGDRVTTEVNSVTSKINNVDGKVNNMKIGGRNLLKGTRDFNSKYWYQYGDSTFLEDNPVDSSVKEIHSYGDWASFRYKQTIQLDPNKNYMISADIAIYDGDGNGLYVTPYGTVDGQGSNLAGTDVNLAGFPRQVKGEGFRRIYLPVTAHGRTLKDFRIEGHGNWSAGKGSVFISKIALYEGNTPLAWSDSSDDFVEAIKEVNTKWDVANGQIQGKVTETDVNNILNGKGYATQSWAQTMFQMKSDSITLQAVRDNITNGIQNQVNSIDQKLNNTKIGNKNLFVGTNRGDYGWMLSPGNGATSKGSLYIDGQNGVRFTNSRKTTSWWVIQFPFDMNKLKPNTSYTISFDIRTPQDRNENAFIGLARGDSSGSPFVESPYKAIHTKANRFVHITQTLTTTSNFEKNQQAFYLNNAGIGQCDWVDIVNLMMVEGTQSAEWSPAPEEAGSGQNLLRGTADFSWPTGIGTNGTVNLGYEKYDAATIQLHVWGKDSGIYTKWSDAFPDGELQVGAAYTFSFDIKGNGTFSAVKNESEGHNPANGIKVNEEWQRVSVSGTVKSLGKAYIIYFQGDYDVRIKNVKIERGAIATPWTPHPFDDKDKGVNLLKSTAYWNPSDWNHISDNVWYDDGWVDSKGHKAYGHHTAWQGLGQTVYVTPGVYTWSAQIYLNGLDSNDSVYPYMGDGQYNDTAQVQDIRKPMLGVNDQNRWIDYSTTFYVKNAGNLCVRPELNRDHGNIHVGSQKLEHGMVATPWSPSPYDSDPKNIVSAINITPDQIKIASNKIVIDGNTDIRGDLRTDRVRLVGKNGAIDMTGDTGIKLTNNDGSSMLLGRGNVDLMYKNDFRMNIDSSLMTIMQRNQFTDQNKPIAILNIGASWNHSYEKIRGADIRYNPGNVNDVNLHGADYLALSYNKPNLTPGEANIKPQLVMAYQDLKFDENHYLWRKGVNVADDLTIQEYQRINVGYRDKEDQSGKWTNDPLMIHRMQWSNSYQADRYQPTIRLGYGPNSYGHAGVTFLWDQVKPFGDRDISDLGSIWFNGLRFSFGWVHNNRMMGGQNQPAFMRFDDKGGITSGIAFAPGSTWDLGTGAWNITASVMNHGG